MLSNRINRLVKPPRSVPLPVVVSAMVGITGLIGGVFLIMGMIFTIIFTQGYRPIDDLRLAFAKTTAQGVITQVLETNSTENDEWVYQNEYTFTTSGGTQVSGQSYTTGRQWSRQAPVTIEYVPENPRISRISGTRTSMFMPWVLFVLIFPGVGALLFGWGVIGGLRQVALLRDGEVADARILSQRPTNVSVNNQPVIEYSYEIRTSSGETYNGSAKSLPKDRIGDEENEPALYLPSDPDRSTLVDAIPLSHPLDVDELSGEWVAQENMLKVVLYFLTWILAIGIGAYWLYQTFGPR